MNLRLELSQKNALGLGWSQENLIEFPSIMYPTYICWNDSLYFTKSSLL